MPRRNIPFVPDQYYHFYNRGNNRRIIFFERDNYLYFLKGIKRYLNNSITVIAYCLMPTHYHILGKVKSPTSETQTSEVLKTSEVSNATNTEISTALMRLSVSYTKAINKRFNRVGPLFQGQFKGKPVQQYNHLINLCLYIHANPVKDGLVVLPEDWDFSNYQEWLGIREGTLVDRQFIADNFDSTEEYRKMIMDYVKARNLPEDVRRYLQVLEG
jgi:REP element-mobilizing transposase RayT